MEGLTQMSKESLQNNFGYKGNNLLALHSLKEEFAGKVKLIYIDPPYNTKMVIVLAIMTILIILLG